MNRRRFLKVLAGATAAASFAPVATAQALEEINTKKLFSLSAVAPCDGEFTLSCFVRQNGRWHRRSSHVTAREGEWIFLYANDNESIFGLQLEMQLPKAKYLKNYSIEAGTQNLLEKSEGI